ncbi:MAG: glycerate kinase [Bacilli bacterium]
MKVLAIIDSFKGTLTSKELGEITKKQLAKRAIDCDYFPISDGGDGFLECIEHLTQTNRVNCTVYDPLFRNIETYYLKDQENTVYIEMALASGINLLQPQELNPYQTSTYGTGQFIKHAIENGAKKIVVGIGGSATNDGGAGMLEAMGATFFHGNLRLTRMNCQKLDLITDIDVTPLMEFTKQIEFIVLNDVKNPLLGTAGATYIYSKQKGSQAHDLPILEAKMQHYATICRQTVHDDYSQFPGTGAAGGLGFAFKTFMSAIFYQGTGYVLNIMNFKAIVDNYDYIITGEGKIDSQSLLGKVVFAIKSQAINKKVILVCAINELTAQQIQANDIEKVYAIVPQFASAKESLKRPHHYYNILCEHIRLI